MVEITPRFWPRTCISKDMKNLFLKRLICLIFVVIITPTALAETDCLQGQANLFWQVGQSTKYLREAVEASKVKENLMNANIKYGFVGLKVGTAKIYLTTSEGKIVDLNVDADVNVAGLVKEKISQRVTLSQIKRGEPLKFQMAGSNRGVLIVQPGPGMDENGGSATLKIWNGKKYTIEKIEIKKVNGRFKVFLEKNRKKKEVSGLSVTMGGMSVPKMYVSKYKISTK